MSIEEAIERREGSRIERQTRFSKGVLAYQRLANL